MFRRDTEEKPELHIAGEARDQGPLDVAFRLSVYAVALLGDRQARGDYSDALRNMNM